MKSAERTSQVLLQKVGYDQLHIIPDIATDLTNPNVEMDVTERMRHLIDVPLSELINLESSDIAHLQSVQLSLDVADGDMIPNNYQPDSEPAEPKPKHNVTTTEAIDHLSIGKV